MRVPSAEVAEPSVMTGWEWSGAAGGIESMVDRWERWGLGMGDVGGKFKH